MSDVIVLLPHDAPSDEALIWCAQGAGGAVRWARFADELPPGDVTSVVAIAPGVDVTQHDVVLPAGSEAQARAAAPFAVEDEIALDVEAIHTALGPKPAAGEPRAVAVVSLERMRAWQEALEHHGLRAVRMVADYSVLASPPEGHATVMDSGDRVLVRTVRGGLAVERDLAGMIIPAILNEQDLERVEVWTNAPRVLGLDAINADITHHPGLSETESLAQWMRGAQAEHAVDLLQGPFRVRRRGDRGAWRRWRAAGVLAGVASLLAVVGIVLETTSYRSAAADLRAHASQAYADAFPTDGRVSDPRARVQTRLAQSGGAVGFIELSAVAFEAAAPLERMQIESLRYDHSDRTLLVGMIYDSYADVETFTAAALERGVVVEEGGSRRSGRRMSGEVTLRAP